MYKRKRILIALMLILVLPLSSAAAETQTFNTVLFDSSAVVGDEAPLTTDSVAAIGDTLYLLAGEALYHWRPGDAKPTAILTQGFVNAEQNYLESEERSADGVYVSRLFAADGVLYGYDEQSGAISVLTGEGAPRRLAAVDLASLADTERFVQNGRLLRVFSSGGKIFLLLSSYGEKQESLLVTADLSTGAVLHQTRRDDLSDVAPYRDGRLLALTQNAGEWNEETGEPAPGELVSLDPATGDVSSICTLISGTDMGLVYGESANTAYFISKAKIYGLPGMRPEPKISAYLPNEATMGFGQSVALLEGGLYVYADYSGVIIRGLNADAAAGGALTIYGEYGSDAHQAFVAEHPNIPVTSTSANYENIQQLTAAMLSGGSAVDVLRLGSASVPLKRLIDKGYALDLKDYEGIAAVVDQMYPALSSYIRRGDKLCALPISAESHSIGVNLSVWKENLGLPEANLPKSFAELLDFIRDYAYDYGRAHPDVSLFSDVGVRDLLFNALIEQYVAYDLKNESTIRFDTALFRKLLGKLEAIDYEAIEPNAQAGEAGGNNAEAADGFWQKPSLFTFNADPLRVSAYGSDQEPTPLPLPLDSGLAPVVPVRLTVLTVNPRTAHAKQAAQYLAEYAKRYAPDADGIALFPGRNEEVPNPYYEKDLSAFNSWIAELEAKLETATPENRAALKAELQTEQKALEEYKRKRRISVTAEMIARYRKNVAPYLYVVGQTPLTSWGASGAGELRSIMTQYSQRAISADKLITGLDKRIRIMLLEDQ